jgi:hypothetical protein
MTRCLTCRKIANLDEGEIDFAVDLLVRFFAEEDSRTRARRSRSIRAASGPIRIIRSRWRGSMVSLLAS